MHRGFRGGRRGHARRRGAPRGGLPQWDRRARAAGSGSAAVGKAAGLLFVGWAAHWPYEHGLAWLAQQVLPQAQANGPVVLDVVGARPDHAVAAAEITYHGRVDDVEPFYADAHAVVVPMFEGSGTRLKVIEASFLGAR